MRQRFSSAIGIIGLLGLIITGCGQATSRAAAPTLPPAGITATVALTPTVAGTQAPTTGGPQPYNAAIPGPGCDKGTGRWQALPSAVVRCATDSLQLGNAVGSNFGAVAFNGSTSWGAFPTNYLASINAVVTDAAVGVSIEVRYSAKGAYSVGVSGSGTFSVFGGGILDTQPPAATPPANMAYQIEVKLVGAHITVTVNGQMKGNYTDATFPTGAALLLVANTNANSRTGYVTVKNFAITPLP